MKIIQISPAYKPAYVYGGPTVSVALLCESLVKLDVDLSVFTTTANGEHDFESDETPNLVNKVSVKYFKRLWGGKVHLSVSLLKELLYSTSSEDIYHIHSWWNATAVLSALVGVIRSNRIILSPRGMLTPYSVTNGRSGFKKMFQAIIGRWILNQCCIHVTTEKEKTDVLSFVSHRRITIIPNLVTEPSSMSLRNMTPNEKPSVLRLLFLSRIEKKKGIELLLESLSRANFLWHLTIAGAGDKQYIKYLRLEVKRLKLQERISWIGFVDADDKIGIFLKHDLLVLFSHNENFANVVIESLSSGLPVVISSGVGLANFVIKHNLGWVSEIEPTSLISILELAASDSRKRELINKNAPELIRKHFNEQELSEKYLKMYMSYER